ncbi:EAL domain-containing protein [Fusibacter ferrireducens]|uniref:EAL domain-containing protein n=1 Tax=Fusibacter ferrireducens TaxID=2785058 RepID=A0ABR9ZQY0_9FIRM|nr:EAL domain-containing protein [Fusibacter ferrireducens]MBF4692736.1 EAL domain-containing protein [Fusibacter ferrireducens]
MNRMSIRHQILVLLILMSFLSIAIIGGASLYTGINALKFETIDKTRYVLDSMKSDFEKNIAEADNVMSALETLTLEYLDPNEIKNLDYLETFLDSVAPEVEREAQNHMQSHTAYIYINPNLTHEAFDVYYADQDGNGRVERQTNIPIEYFNCDPSEDKSKSWWFGPVETHKPYWTAPYEWTFDNGNSNEFVSCSMPIYVDDELFAVIGTDMNYDVIQNSLTLYNARALGTSLMLANDKTPLAETTPGNDWYLDKKAIDEALLNGYTEMKTQSGKKLIFLKALSNGWLIGIEIESYKIYQNLLSYSIFILSVMLLAQVIFALLAIKLSDYITDPILAIMASIKASKGRMYALELSQGITNRGDEIGALARTIEKMSFEIQMHIETVKNQSEKIADEVSMRKDAESQLFLILRILEQSDNGVFVLDGAYKIIYANKTFTEITGYEVQRGLSTLGSCGINLTKSQIDQINLENSFQDEIEQLKINGEVYPMQIYMTRIIENEVYYLGLFKDLTDVKLSDQRLNYLKYYDALTKLPNKVLFMDLSEKMIQENSALSYEYAVINIDNFRLLNGVLGSQNCDQIIVEISNRLHQMDLKSGILARTEGDEFSIFYLRDQDEPKEMPLKALKQKLCQPYDINEEEIYITVSIGASTYLGCGTEMWMLVKNANIALNQVKANGKNQIMYYENIINEITNENYILLKELRYALERNEMTLNYQPQVDSRTSEIIGMEALLRWHHNGEQIPPDRFIPLAEESRLIIPIGEFVIDEALCFLRELQSKDIMVPVAINISVEQLKFELIYKQIKRSIERYAIDPKYIELEVTESVIITGREEAIAVIDKLIELGVRVSIDDFGMGYSSLSYLKRFKFHRIKLDRLFIKDFPEKDNGHIASLIIQLANSLEVEIVAEGIEKEVQKEFLLTRGCNFIQGYYYSKPLSKESCLEYIKKSLKIIE